MRNLALKDTIGTQSDRIVVVHGFQHLVEVQDSKRNTPGLKKRVR